jgi:hypothetical protein
MATLERRPGVSATAGVTSGEGLVGAPSGGRRGRWVDRLAARLDVSDAVLKGALQAVRAATPRTDHHADRVAALAAGLGRSEAQVRAALDGGRPRPVGQAALTEALARDLGLDVDDVRRGFAAVQNARRARGRLPGARGIGDALAVELDVDVDRLRAALRALDGPRRGRRGDAQDIATALAVDACEVREILRAFRESETARRETRRAAFAAALAHELGMPTQLVSEALSEMPARRGSRRSAASAARSERARDASAAG